MEFLIADTFTDRLAKLTGDEQKSVKTTAFDLQLNPSASGSDVTRNTSNAIVVLLFPICLETAKLLDVDSRPFLMTLALAASASFMTPIGYQTNLIVYGPGGYRFGDYLRVGVPLNLLLALVAAVLIPWVWPF